jgi:hypothetical protein
VYDRERTGGEAGTGSGDAGFERLGIIGNGGTGGFAVDNGGGTGRERECILEVGDVARREGTEIGLIAERWSCGCGEVCEEAGSGGSGGGGPSCDARLCAV